MTTARDDLGHDVGLVDEPRRIVSLVPSISETLVRWGLADRLVGVTEWCVAPAGAFDHAARVRGTKNPDVGTVVDLRPDVVVANEEENRRADVERLRSEGIEVWVTAPRSLRTVATTIERLGPVVGAPTAARRLADEIRGAIAGAEHERRRLVAPLRAFCPVWRDPWIAVGSDTIVADLLYHAGFQTVVGEPRYPRVELAGIAASDPDVVLLPDEPYEFTADDASTFSHWRADVHPIDGACLTWWGPRTVAALADLTELARIVSRSVGRAR